MPRDEIDINPYAAPKAVLQPGIDNLPPDQHLRRARKILQYLGWGGIVYFTGVTVGLMLDESPAFSNFAWESTVWLLLSSAGVAFFVLMVRTAAQLHTDFDRVYRRARWIAIVAGAVGFPLFTIPFFLAASQLARHRRNRTGNSEFETH